MPIRAVFFDMGGTLIEEAGLRDLLLGNVKKVLAEYGLRARLPDLRRALADWDSLPYRSGLEEYSDHLRCMLLLRRIGIVPRPDLVESLYNAIVQTWLDGYRFYEDALEVVRILKEELRLLVGVITNVGSHDVAYGQLYRGGFTEYLDVVVSSQCVSWRKPSRTIFDIATYMLGVDPSESVYVGDDPVADILGAKTAGMGAVQVVRGNSANTSPLADAVVRSLSDIPGVLQSLYGKQRPPPSGEQGFQHEQKGKDQSRRHHGERKGV